MKSHEFSPRFTNNAEGDVNVGNVIEGDVHGPVHISMGRENGPAVTIPEHTPSENGTYVPFQVGRADRVNDATFEAPDERGGYPDEGDLEETPEAAQDDTTEILRREERERRLEEIREELNALPPTPEDPRIAEITVATRARVAELYGQNPLSGGYQHTVPLPHEYDQQRKPRRQLLKSLMRRLRRSK